MIPSPYQRFKYRHENSPRTRGFHVNDNTRANKTVQAIYARPPFLAVRALLRSYGYHVTGGYQSGKWRSHYMGSWVPFGCFKDGIHHTRWVRVVPGPKLEYSDGSEVPNRAKLGYALAKRKPWLRGAEVTP